MDLPIAIKCEEIDEKLDDTIIDICDVNNEINTQESNKIKKNIVISPVLLSIISHHRQQYIDTQSTQTEFGELTITNVCMKTGKPIWLLIVIIIIVLAILKYIIIACIISVILGLYTIYLHCIYVSAIEQHV